MIYIYLADGFEETEMIAPLDILRRAGLEVKTVSVTESKEVTGSHGITLTADLLENDPGYDITRADLVMLPGGMPGTLGLENSECVRRAVTFAAENGRYIAAICAAPSILGKMGLLRGVKAVCYPGYEKYLEGAVHPGECKVCAADGKFITAAGMGVAVEFGLAIVTELCGKETAEKIRNGIIA